MAKNSDWNDDVKKDGKEKSKNRFDEIEKSVEEDFDNVINFQEAIENIHEDLKIINELNKKHIFINSIGGKSYVTTKMYSEVTERRELEFLQIDTFRNIYMNRTIALDKKSVPIGHFWLQDSKRKTVDGVIFDPSSEDPIVEREGEKYLNLWEGFSCKPRKGKGKWKYTQRHIYKILCNSDPTKFKYLIKWLAWAVQHPDKRAEVAIVFKGEKGTGKSFLFSQFKKIFGIHGMVLTNPNRLTGKFNSHFRMLSFLFCDEVYYPGDKEIEGTVKALITEEFIDTEAKMKDVITSRNRLHIAMATNNDWVIPATKDERRYFIESVNNKYAKNRAPETARKKYFTKIWNEMDSGGREAMLYDLLKYKLKGWHPRNDVPDTKELQKQKELSLDPLQSAIKIMLDDGLFPGECINDTYPVLSETLFKYLEKLEPHAVRFSVVKKANEIKKLGVVKAREGGTGKSKWMFPDLKTARSTWDEKYIKADWNEHDTWAIIKTEF